MDVSQLTKRQLQVLHSVGEGMPIEEIAASLGLAVKTIRKHLANIERLTGRKHYTQLMIAYIDEHFGSDQLPVVAGARAATRLAATSSPHITANATRTTLDAFVDLWLDYIEHSEQAPEAADVAAYLALEPEALNKRLLRIRDSLGFSKLHIYQLVHIAYLARKYEDHLQGEER